MHFFKKFIVAALTGSLILSGISGVSVSAETDDSDYTDEQSVTYTDTYDEGEYAEPDEIPDNSLGEGESFNVFDIYDAYVQYKLNTTMMTTTTTTTATTTTTMKETTTTTTTTTTAVTSRDLSSGLKGIDVSKWQGSIDWAKVKVDGINFAIIRAGYGKYASQEDSYFDTNMVNAEKAGVDCGIYWYSYATTVEEAYLEAEACYSVIKGYSFDYPLVFDIEEDAQYNLSTATVSAIIDAFCSTMESKGYYVSLYSYANFLNTKVYSSVLEKYDIWVSHFYVSTPSYYNAYGMWQYTNLGTVNGISGNVDLDYAYKDYPYLMKKYGLNGC